MKTTYPRTREAIEFHVVSYAISLGWTYRMHGDYGFFFRFPNQIIFVQFHHANSPSNYFTGSNICMLEDAGFNVRSINDVDQGKMMLDDADASEENEL